MSEETFSPPTKYQGHLATVEQSRAVQEVQAALVIAKKFPRDTTNAFQKIVESCKRYSLAEKAVYRYPRGGETVSGPSIRLAEVLAQNWGNLEFGVMELERRVLDNGRSVSIAESYCWDMETNVRQKKIFEVPHVIDRRTGGPKILTEARDIYEHVANNGARRLRACILGIIPGDIVDAAVNECKKTMGKGNGEPLIDRVRKAVSAFKDVGVSQEMLEAWLGHKIDVTTAEEIVELTSIYQSIRDGQAKREDFFEFSASNFSNTPAPVRTMKDLEDPKPNSDQQKPSEPSASETKASSGSAPQKPENSEATGLGSSPSQSDPSSKDLNQSKPSDAKQESAEPSTEPNQSSSSTTTPSETKPECDTNSKAPKFTRNQIGQAIVEARIAAGLTGPQVIKMVKENFNKKTEELTDEEMLELLYFLDPQSEGEKNDN